MKKLSLMMPAMVLAFLLQPALLSPAAVAAPPEAAQKITVYKSPTCGCCKLWIEHLEEEGFVVEAFNSDDMNAIKKEFSVPKRMTSCHTATVGGYTIEGHVPAADIRRLLVEQPEATGLAVPGMPVGSPGMEYRDRVDPYDVVLFSADEEAVFESYGKPDDSNEAADAADD